MGVQGHSSNSWLQSTMSESTQLCKAHHYLIYHTLHPLPTCVMSDTSQVSKCQTMPQSKYNWKVLTLKVTLQRVTKFVSLKWCYEAKVEENDKLPWVEARTPLPWTTSALPLATAIMFTFLYFCLITSKLIHFQHETRCSEHLWPRSYWTTN